MWSLVQSSCSTSLLNVALLECQYKSFPFAYRKDHQTLASSEATTNVVEVCRVLASLDG